MLVSAASMEKVFNSLNIIKTDERKKLLWNFHRDFLNFGWVFPKFSISCEGFSKTTP